MKNLAKKLKKLLYQREIAEAKKLVSKLNFFTFRDMGNMITEGISPSYFRFNKIEYEVFRKVWERIYETELPKYSKK